MLRFSKSRVPLLFIVLVANGVADKIFVYVYVMFACVLVTVNILNFNIMCLGRSSRSCCRLTLCGLGYRFIRLSIVHTYMRFWLLCSCSLVSDVSYLAPVMSGLGNHARYFSLTFSEWVF